MPYAMLSLEEAAEFLHLPPEDVRSLAMHGELPCERQGDRLVFRKAELQPWATQRILGLRGKHLHDYHSRGLLHHHDLSPRNAIITELTDAAWLEPRLEARTRGAAIRAMVALAERTELLYDPRELTAELEQREDLCSTGIEGGAALLHPRFHDPYLVDDSFLCVGVCARPLPFGAPDGGKTDVFFLICCQDDKTHLHVLARVCMLCHHTELLEGLRNSTSGEEMFESIKQTEKELTRFKS